jgi:hypothetical protein
MTTSTGETHSATRIKTLPAPSVKRLLREAGYTMSDVARLNRRHHSLVWRVIRKQSKSDAVWARIAWCLDHPRNGVK